MKRNDDDDSDDDADDADDDDDDDDDDGDGDDDGNDDYDEYPFPALSPGPPPDHPVTPACPPPGGSLQGFRVAPRRPRVSPMRTLRLRDGPREPPCGFS